MLQTIAVMLEEAVRLVGSGEIDPGVTGVYPLGRAAGEHRVSRTGPPQASSSWPSD